MSISVRVTNFSDGPIHEVVTGLEVSREGGAQPSTQYVEVSYVPPREHCDIEFTVPTGRGSLGSGNPRVWFIDIYGRRWTRVANDVEPERIYKYVDPRMSEEFRTALEQAMREEPAGRVRRALRRFGRD